MGEPATQLTMRTFHLGGVAMGADIVQGLPRVEELFEARVPKGVAVMSDLDGTVEIVGDDDQTAIRIVSAHVHEERYELADGVVPIVEDGDTVAKDAVLALPREHAEELLARKAKSKSNTISKRAIANVGEKGPRATADGVVTVRDGEILLRSHSEETSEYRVSAGAEVHVRNGQLVTKGEQLTAGPLNPKDILRLRGRESLQHYVIEQVQGVYRMVGVEVNNKHIEVIIRQMLRRVSVEMPGDTDLLPGTLVPSYVFDDANEKAIQDGQRPATAHWTLLGFTKASLNNESSLAAASFQDTTRVLTEAVVDGKTDHLHGLKENVIIGKLIPAGTGWKRHREGTLLSSNDDGAEQLGTSGEDLPGEGEKALIGAGLTDTRADGGSDEGPLVAGLSDEASAAKDEFTAFLSTGADEPIEEPDVQGD